MPKRRIVLISEGLYPEALGGAGVAVHQLARRYVALGHRTFVVTANIGNVLPEKEKTRAGYTVLRYPVDYEGKMNYYLSCIKGTDVLVSKLKTDRGKVDIWHYHGHIAALGSRLNGKLKRSLRVATHYAPVSDRFMVRELGRLCGTGTLEKGRVYSEGSIFALLFENMEYKNYLKSNRVLVHTEVDRRRLLTGKMKKRQLVNIIPGVDTKYFSPARRSKEFSEKTFGKGTPVVGYIGRLDGLKGPDLFLEAAYLLLRERKKARFVIVGEGPGEDAVRTLAAGMGLRRHITFLPVSLQNYSRIVAGFDVLVSTSIEEKVRLVLFEALASGVPVAAFNIGGIAEYITHGREGVLAPYGDSRTLAFRLADFLEGDHGDLSGRLRKRSLEHDWTRVAGNILNIYEDLIARGR